MVKGFSTLMVLVVVAAVAGVGLFVANSQFDIFAGNPDSQLGPQEGISVEEISADDMIYDNLKSQLLTAQETGGISPESYSEISAAIQGLGDRRYDGARMYELRTLLSLLQVGDEVGGSPNVNTTEMIAENTTEVIVEDKRAIFWKHRFGKWEAPANPPACPDPIVFQSPVDLDSVTAILYPGQVRSGDFKPHGGFFIDGRPAVVTSPIEGNVWRVAKFTDEFGLHYMFDIQHPCGIMVRLGHLGAVPSKMEAIFENVETGGYGESFTHEVDPVWVEAGEVIATDIQGEGYGGFDWGAYDLRQENEASKDPAFREAYTASDAEQAFNAICWFDYLPPEQESVVRSLPAGDGKEGKNSAYC